MAAADITAQDVWQSQKDVLAAVGGELSGEVSRDGNSETISDVSIVFELPFEQGRIQMTGLSLKLTENEDGSVSIAYLEPVVMELQGTIEGEGSVSAQVGIDVLNGLTVAKGEPSDITWTYSADQVALELLDLSGNIPETDVSDFAVSGVIADISGQTRIQVAEQIISETSSTLGAQNFEYHFTDQLGTKTAATAKADTTIAESDLVLPRGGMDIMNLASALKDGLKLSLTSSTTGYGTTQTVTVDDEVLSEQSTQSALQEVSYAFDAEGIKMDGLAQDSQMEFVLAPILPAPISASIANISGTLQLPVSAGEAPQDAEIDMVMDGLRMDEALWSMFDPDQVLPRTPAKVELGLTAQVRNFVDWLNFPQVQNVVEAGERPVEPVAMSLNRLDIDMAGAKLTGTGDLSFDNDDTETYGGVPKPVGGFDLTLNGINTLIDNLISIGLIQDQDAMGARMMLGIVTNPDPSGDKDALISQIELTEDGHILANGQRLK
ncbi:MAG: DUF2125 domain-containing protein [Paracoccaceae bacterium]